MYKSNESCHLKWQEVKLETNQSDKLGLRYRCDLLAPKTTVVKPLQGTVLIIQSQLPGSAKCLQMISWEWQLTITDGACRD